MASGRARIGTSGWQYADWRGRFYPAELSSERWLEHYSACFDTVEVNNTFYNLPARKVFARWARRVGYDFCFALKFSRFATHYRSSTGRRHRLFGACRRSCARSAWLRTLGMHVSHHPLAMRRDEARAAGANGSVRVAALLEGDVQRDGEAAQLAIRALRPFHEREPRRPPR